MFLVGNSGRLNPRSLISHDLTVYYTACKKKSVALNCLQADKASFLPRLDISLSGL